jgi:hypothetical protein
MINIINRILFQFRWTFMSREKRYAYLWNRTSNHPGYYR